MEEGRIFSLPPLGKWEAGRIQIGAKMLPSPPTGNWQIEEHHIEGRSENAHPATCLWLGSYWIWAKDATFFWIGIYLPQSSLFFFSACLRSFFSQTSEQFTPHLFLQPDGGCLFSWLTKLWDRDWEENKGYLMGSKNLALQYCTLSFCSTPFGSFPQPGKQKSVLWL